MTDINSSCDFKRYSRLSSLPGIGKSGISSLRKGKVLVVGCGALGSMCAMQLCASGVGTIGIIDFDTIDLTNLQRQFFYDESQLGRSKAEVLLSKMKNLNSGVNVNVFNDMLTPSKARDIIGGYDIIVEGSDNPATKYMVSEVCESLGIPYCIGGVRGFTGQVVSWEPGHNGYREIFGPQPADDETAASMLPCSAMGVFGPAAASVASMQASEVLKYITGAGEMLTDRLWCADLLTNSFRIIPV